MEKSFGERVAEAKAAVTSISPTQAHQLRQAGVEFIDPRPADAIASTTSTPGPFRPRSRTCLTRSS